MISTEDKKAVIYNAINSAICIDDQYESPYCDIPENRKYFDDSKELYISFRKDGKCDLDIYKFRGYDGFDNDKDFLLNHKDLMILDWELDATFRIKHESTLKILDNAVANKYIRWVAIYTNEQDDYNILLNIYAYFCIRKTSDELKAEINDKLFEVLEIVEEKSEAEDVETDFMKKLNDIVSAFTLSPKEEQDCIIKELKRYICSLFPQEDSRECCNKLRDIVKGDLNILLTYYEIVNKSLEILHRVDEKKYSVHILGRNYLLINGTVIFVLKKEITPDDVYGKVTDAICNIPNQRTLLLSLMLKNILSEELGIGGKGLGGITDRMLLHHWESYEEENIDNLIEFLVLCIKEDIAEAMRTYIEAEKIREIFKRNEDETETAKEQELALFNKILTFVSKEKLSNQERHQIKTGDIFKLKTDLHISKEKVGVVEEYIICVSQSCDCLRPTKIHNNYAFVYGSTDSVKLRTALKEIEKEGDYSIISDTKAIKWDDSFLTIHIENNKFNVNDDFVVKIENKDIQLEYVGGLKDFYAQRIVNKIFNHALRIGVDLPHIK